MGKWMDTLKSMPERGFVSFGSATVGHFPEKKPIKGGFVSFGSATVRHIDKITDDEIKRQALKKLAAAAQGLPVTLDELAVFFADDLHGFGIGEVSREGIRKAAEWFARVKTGIPIESDTRVTCTTCKQTGCPYPLTYGRHNSPQPRNCKAWSAAR